MKQNQLKELLKHIISEVTSQVDESRNYDDFDDPSNVANAIYSGLYKDPDNEGIDKTDGGQVYSFTLHSNSGPRHMIKRTPDGEWFYSDSTGEGRVWKYAGNYIAAKKNDRAEYARTGKLANEMVANEGSDTVQCEKCKEKFDGSKSPKQCPKCGADSSWYNTIYEMIANKDVAPDVFGAVNVEESDKKKKRICYHCKQPSPCKCDKYDDEMGKRIAQGDPAFKTKIDRKDEGDVKKKDKELLGKVKKISKVSDPESNSEYFKISLKDPDSEHIIRKDKEGELSLGKETDGKLNFEPVEEETGCGAVAGYSTPFAFKATGGAGKRRKKKKKHVKEGHFLNKVKEKIHGTVDVAKSLKNEKILPDGRYDDDMEDGRRSNRIAGMSEMDEPYDEERLPNDKKKLGGKSEIFRTKLPELQKAYDDAVKMGKSHIDINGGNYATAYIKYLIDTSAEGNSQEKDLVKGLHNWDLKEMTSSSAAGGQPGGTIQTPAWGTKNKLGSQRGIKGSEKLGYKVVRSITNENVEDGFKPIDASVPENQLLNVRWGKSPNVEYGVAKYVHGKWWNYTSQNPHDKGRECAAPQAWHSVYKF